MFKKHAFTLAEVLITLAVIGIVAALTIGVFLPKIHSKIRESQIATAEVKFTKAMEQMALNNAIGPYYGDTQKFVDELQNYFKVAKVCDNEHLEDCFGYNEIKLDDNETIEIKDIKDGSLLGLENDSTHEYGTTVSILTIDGTAMLLTWNQKCDILEPGVYKWGGNTNESTNCVSMVMDVNLDRDVNRLGKDVALFNANHLNYNCSIKFFYEGKRYCWGAPFWTNQMMSAEECNNKKAELGINNCKTDDNNAWAYAVDKCKGVTNMPTRADLAAFAGYLFNKTGEIGIGATVTGTFDTSKLPSSLPSASNFRIWSGQEGGQGAAHTRTFGAGGSDAAYDATQGSYIAVCKIK